MLRAGAIRVIGAASEPKMNLDVGARVVEPKLPNCIR